MRAVVEHAGLVVPEAGGDGVDAGVDPETGSVLLRTRVDGRRVRFVLEPEESQTLGIGLIVAAHGAHTLRQHLQQKKKMATD